MDLNQIYELYKLSLGNLYYIFPKMQFNIYYLKEIVDFLKEVTLLNQADLPKKKKTLTQKDA